MNLTSRWSSDFLDGNKGGKVREIWHSPVDSVDLLDNVSMHKTVLRKEIRDGLEQQTGEVAFSPRPIGSFDTLPSNMQRSGTTDYQIGFRRVAGYYCA